MNYIFCFADGYLDFVSVCDEDGRCLGCKYFYNSDDPRYGYIKHYDALAKKIYKILANGRALRIKNRLVYADDVPEFMMECALNGLA